MLSALCCPLPMNVEQGLEQDFRRADCPAGTVRMAQPSTARIGCLACTHGSSRASPKEANETGRRASDSFRTDIHQWGGSPS